MSPPVRMQGKKMTASKHILKIVLLLRFEEALSDMKDLAHVSKLLSISILVIVQQICENKVPLVIQA